MKRATRRCLTICLTGLIPLATARAQGPDDVVAAPAAPAVQAFVLNDAQFGQWTFGEQDLSAVRTRLASKLELKVDFVERACGLTAVQKQKLELAGRGDLKRLWDRVEEKRRRYVNVAHDQNKLNEIVQDLQSVRNVAIAEPFGEGTLFGKTLNATLTTDQVAHYEKAVRDQKHHRYRAKIALAVTMLDQSVGFREQQRGRLQRIIEEETQPPLKFGPQDVQAILVQLAKLPDDMLKPLCDDIQWRILRRRLDQSRPMEQVLINNGILPGVANAPAALPGPVPVMDGVIIRGGVVPGKVNVPVDRPVPAKPAAPARTFNGK